MFIFLKRIKRVGYFFSLFLHIIHNLFAEKIFININTWSKQKSRKGQTWFQIILLISIIKIYFMISKLPTFFFLPSWKRSKAYLLLLSILIQHGYNLIHAYLHSTTHVKILVTKKSVASIKGAFELAYE